MLSVLYTPSGSLLPSLGACLGISTGYVASVYLLPGASGPRDQTETVQRRILGVVAGTIASIAFCRFACEVSAAPGVEGGHWWALGLDLVARPRHHVLATLATLAAFGTLFLGPVIQESVDGTWWQRPRVRSWLFCRNFVVAPLTEELVFRCCLMALLQPALGTAGAAWLAPLFFGVAHLHHLYGGETPALVAAQFAYTTVFGWLAALVFTRTRSAPAVIVAHAFCNFMGFPDVAGAFGHRRHQLLLSAAYVAGLAGAVALAVYA
jgi:prenyl protein peptidase